MYVIFYKENYISFLFIKENIHVCHVLFEDEMCGKVRIRDILALFKEICHNYDVYVFVCLNILNLTEYKDFLLLKNASNDNGS